MIPLSYSWKSLIARRSAATLAAIGIAMVVFVFTSMMMLAAGIESTMSAAGSVKNTLIIAKGSKNHFASRIPDASVRMIESHPAVAQVNGEPAVAAEVLGYLLVTTRDHRVRPISVRGVTSTSFELHDRVRVNGGRRFSSGTEEVIVGAAIAKQVRELFGQQLAYRGDRSFKVVGTFAAEGSTFESEVWGDRETMRSVLDRTSDVSVVTVRTINARGRDELAKTLDQDNLALDAINEREFYQSQARELSIFMTALALVAGFIFAAAAVLGAMTTMYAMVAGRQREIGTLRALGFEGNAIVLAFMFEALILSLLGAGIGCLGLLALAFVRVELMNPATMAVVAFRFTVNPQVLMLTVIFAVVIGVISGLSPAIAAARIQPSQAMRAG